MATSVIYGPYLMKQRVDNAMVYIDNTTTIRSFYRTVVDSVRNSNLVKNIFRKTLVLMYIIVNVTGTS